MEAFGLGPLPQGWEAKFEQKTGRIYFINHRGTSTTCSCCYVSDGRVQHTPYFEDVGGSRWSSPVPSVRTFSLNRRGSSPRLGGSPRIAPSPIPAPRTLRNEQQIVLGGSSEKSTQPPATSSSTLAFHTAGPIVTSSSSLYQHDTISVSGPAPGTSRGRSSSIGTANHTTLLINNNEIPLERPQSARSFSSVSYSGVPSTFLSTCDTETGFRTVCALFPTAGAPHVRHLFHKYHNRATLVVSALQVEKHPYVTEIANQLELKLSQKEGDGDTDTIASIGETKSIGIHSPFKTNSYTTGSPARTGTPVSLLKFSNNPSSAGSIHTRWGSPLLSLSPQLQMVKEESQVAKSPKMKLKYLKGIFSAADETFLLDVLASCENNVQKATEKMLKKGFSRTPPAKPARQKWLEVKLLIEKRNKALEQQSVVNQMHISMGEPVESPFPTPIMKPARPHLTADDKDRVKVNLIKRFSNLPDRFVAWAAEAAKFDLEKAARLLQEVGPETPDEFKPFVVSSPVNDAPGASAKDTDRRVVRFAETPPGSGTMAEVVTSVTGMGNVGGLTLNKLEDFKTTDIDTPDSGYFELEGKARKKNFIASLFGSKMEKDREKDYIKANKTAKGPNSSYAKGSNPTLLQPNYVATNGPSFLQKGPQNSNRVASSGLAMGPNPTLAKGSIWGTKKHNLNNSSNMHHVTVGG